MTLRRWSIVTLALAALMLLVGRVVAGVYVDYRWYAAMGALSLWKKKTALSLALRLASGAVAAAFVFANLYAVRRSVVSLVLPRRVANIEIGEEVPGRYLVGAAAILSVVLGALLSVPRHTWSTLLLVRSGVSASHRITSTGCVFDARISPHPSPNSTRAPSTSTTSRVCR